jgi:hypothetical protein
MRSVVVLLMAGMIATAFGYVSVYKTEPVKAAWSGRVGYDVGVGQGVVCNFAEPIYADYFTGTATSQQYQVQLKFLGEDGLVVAHGQRYEADDHVWVRCTLNITYPESIIKGRLYEVRWTLSGGSDSLMYYYDSTDRYEWGQIILPDQQVPVPDSRDLACRVVGRLDPVDSSYWAADLWQHVPWDSADSANRRRLRDSSAMLADGAGLGTMMVYAY